jgi:uroporphyrinogen decarboxylase
MTNVVTKPEHLRDIKPLDASDGVFGEHLRALGILMHGVMEDVDVLHTIFSPMSIVAMLCGAPKTFIEFAKADGQAAHAAIRSATTTLTAYARASIEEGASGIFYAPLIWASRDTCDDAFYQEFGRPYDLEILAAVSDADFNVMHVCRNHNMIENLLDYPVAAFNWADHGEGNLSLDDVHGKTKTAVMGGVDNAHIHKMSADDVASQARKAMAVGNNVFVTAGCAIPPQTPAENRMALVKAVRG